MKNKSFVFAILLTLALPIRAQTAFSSSAGKPDQTVFGIRLGAALEIPECSKVTVRRSKKEEDWFYSPAQSTMCFCRDGLETGKYHTWDAKTYDQHDWWTVVFPVGRTPEIMARLELIVLVMDSRVEAVRFITPTNDDRVLSALTIKYGPPAGTKSLELQNGFGARFTSTTTVWADDGLTVSYCSGYCGTTSDNTGEVTVSTQKAAEHFKALMDALPPKPTL